MKVKPVLVIGLLLITLGLIIGIKPKYDVKIIDIDKPSEQIVELVQPIANIITDPNDKAKIALFNYEFSQRVKKYDTDVQKLNDVYVVAASKFFKDTLTNKYEDLDSKLVSLLSQTTTGDNHVLSESEKNELSASFSGLSWVLINK